MRLPQQLEACPEFECPVATLNALVDMKLVALLDRNQTKDFEDIFFALWGLPLDEVDGLPYFAERYLEQSINLSARLEERAKEYAQGVYCKAWPGVFKGNLEFLKKSESKGAVLNNKNK